MAKKTKEEADYGLAKPGGDKCRECRWFRAGSCEIVEGKIAPEGWCKFYHQKKAFQSPMSISNRIAELRRR